MKKKRLIGLFIVLGILIVLIPSLILLDNDKPEGLNKSKKEESSPKEELMDEVEKEYGYKIYRPEQTIKVEDAKKIITVNKNADELEVVENMHLMTHQKVQAEQKNGAIQMTSSNINSLYDIVENSNFSNKMDLLYILKRWANNDFSVVDNDHNRLLTIQGGKVGIATGRLTTREEKEFIANNFE